MLIIFNMPERKISDEVSKSCNHVEYRWVMLASCSYPENKSRKKADTRSVSMNVHIWMCVRRCVRVFICCSATTKIIPRNVKPKRVQNKKRKKKSCDIEIKFSIYGNYVFGQNKKKNTRISNKMNIFMNLKAVFLHSAGAPLFAWGFVLHLLSSLVFVAREITHIYMCSHARRNMVLVHRLPPEFVDERTKISPKNNIR